MLNQNKRTPRVFIARHGETEWVLLGRRTGKSDIPLNANGAKQIQGTANVLVGPGKLIDPSKIAHIFSSPRQRALTSLDVMLGDQKERLMKEDKITVTEDIAEWDFGDYEGLTASELREVRKEKPWDIWTEGCEGVGGESAAQVQERLDRLIQKIHEIQEPYMHGGVATDVLLVSHSQIFRAFTKRWLKYPMDFPFTMAMEPGTIGVLSYAHRNVDEPSIVVGMGFPYKE